MIVREIECRSILSPSGISGVDYALNPYVGCAHACAYCYATFMKRFSGHAEEWGTFVDVKANAALVLARQMRRARPGCINFGTVTDAYQPLEEQYGITRACLEALVDLLPQAEAAGSSWPITVLTKSALVQRDLDLLARLPHVEVALTITTVDDELRQHFEPGASPVAARLEALATLAGAGIRTWAFCGPLLPYLSDGEAEIDALFAALRAVRAGAVLVDSLNLRGTTWSRVRPIVTRHWPDLVPLYRDLAADRRPYHAALTERTRRLAARHGLEWREVRIVYDQAAAG